MYGAKFMMEKLIIAYIVYAFGYSLMVILISGVGSKFTMETFLSLAVRMVAAVLSLLVGLISVYC